MNIILQRQGVSHNLRTNYGRLLTPGIGNDCPPFHAEINHCHLGKSRPPGFVVEVTYAEKRHRRPREPLTSYPAPGLARAALAELLTDLLGEPVTVDGAVEMYCYPPTPGDIELARARYEPGSDTIRSVPENYCLVEWREGLPVFNTDAADEPPNGPHIHPNCYWRKICAAAHNAYLQPVNRPGTEHGKRWLAWLISEWRKYGIQS